MRALLCILFLLAGCVDPSPAGWQAGDAVPSLQMATEVVQRDGDEVVRFAVTGVQDGPLARSDVRIGVLGCAWHVAPTGVVSVGDTVECTRDDVLSLIHSPSGQLVFSNCGGCTQLEPDGGSQSTNPPGAQQPAIAWSVSQSAGTATVTSADSATDWSEFQVKFTRSGKLGVNENPQNSVSAGVSIGTAYVALPAGGIGAGDTLAFCVTTVGDSLTATLLHTASNSIAREFIFNSPKACAGQSQPSMSWSISQADGSATVTSATSNRDWNEFTIKLSPAGKVGLNENPQSDASAGFAVGAAYAQLPQAGIGGGDTLFFCVDGTQGSTTATLRHTPSNAIAREFVFNNLPSCA